MLKDDGLQLCGSLDDRVQLRFIRAQGDPKFDADHRPVADAAVDFGQAFFDVFRIDIDKAKGAMMPVAQGLEHLVVLLAEVLRSRIER